MYNNSSAGLMYPMVCPFWNFTVVLFFFFTPLGCMNGAMHEIATICTTPRQILMAIAFDRTLFITISGKELVL